MSPPAHVQEIYITHRAGAPMSAVAHVDAVMGRGLVGDRYYLGTGHYSGQAGWGHHVTLIQSEAIAAINGGHQTEFTGAMLRRNLVTADVKLEALIGRTFRCGSAVLRGTKEFPPCVHLAMLIHNRDILRYLAYCGGIGAEIVESGIIGLHDSIILMDR